ncbi:MAG: thioesterase family protein [Pseudomonadota bacterium]
MSDFLKRDDLVFAGLPAKFSFGIRDRVRFHEIDALNHVNNIAYLRWTENLRVNMLPHIGLGSFAGEKRNIVLRAQDIEYFAPMHLFDDYIVAARCSRIGNSSLDMEYEVHCKGVVTVRVTSQIVMVNAAMTASMRIPDEARAIILEIDGIR